MSEIVCYHGFQSFKHGEVTPEQAHEVGVKLAERMWGDRFQVIVATHLNTDCLHNHFVVNSVSFADGMHYHDNKANLRLLRQRSDAKVVYDISETSAKDRRQEQEPKSMRELVSALIDASPVPCVPVDELELPAYYDGSQQTIFVKKGLSEEVLFVSMAKEVSAAVYDFKYNESRDASDFKSLDRSIWCISKSF